MEKSNSKLQIVAGVLIVLIGLFRTHVKAGVPNMRSKIGGNEMIKRGKRMLGLESSGLEKTDTGPLLDQMFNMLCGAFPEEGNGTK